MKSCFLSSLITEFYCLCAWCSAVRVLGLKVALSAKLLEGNLIIVENLALPVSHLPVVAHPQKRLEST